MIEKALAELKRFSEDLVTFHPPVQSGLIDKFEKKYNIILPNDYKYLLLQTNGCDLAGTEILGLYDEKFKVDLFDTYEFEHKKVQVPQFDYLVPFSPDGGGNFECFDTTKVNKEKNACQIVFWVSNYPYSAKDEPGIINDSLSDWINEMIEWVLKDYNYDGSHK